jgi:hypothetical protein
MADETLTPEEHYNWSLNLLVRSNEDEEAGGTVRTNTLLEALTHTMLGVLRSELDYASQQSSNREKAKGG